MTDIEERAWNSAVKRMQGDSYYALGYKEGATEQKAIDEDHLREVKKMVIDKACKRLYEWNQKQAKMYGAKGTLSITEYTINVCDFRKAMEE